MLFPGSGQCAADGIEHAQRGIVPHREGHVLRTESARPLRQRTRGRDHLLSSRSKTPVADPENLVVCDMPPNCVQPAAAGQGML